MIEITNMLDVEKHIDDVEAVIFDLDDTLYSEKDYIRSGFHAIAVHFNQVEGLETELWKAFEEKKPAIDDVFERNGILQCRDEALTIYRVHMPNIELYPGVSQMIDRIKRTKKVGIITDGRPEGQHNKIKSLGLSVDFVIITDELGGIECRKPNDLAFRIMQQNVEMPFHKMVYVGDNTAKDFIAPEKLGMRTIHFRNTDGLYR